MITISPVRFRRIRQSVFGGWATSELRFLAQRSGIMNFLQEQFQQSRIAEVG